MNKKKIGLFVGIVFIVLILIYMNIGGKKEEASIEEKPKVEEKAETKPSQPVKKELTYQEKREEKISLKGSEIFKKYNCGRCHSATGVRVGPPLEEIALAYKGKKDELIAFLKGERPAKLAENVGESSHLMNIQLAALKELTDKELSELADYILSFAK